jgi:Family of unknown function (DUF6261)
MLTLVYPAHHRLRNSEFIRFAKDVATVCNLNNPPALKIEGQLNSFTATFDELNRLFKIAQGNKLTAELQALDDRRDQALIGIRLYAESFLYRRNADLVKAGEWVLGAYDKYGKRLHRLNYYAETEVVEGLTTDLTTEPELVAALKTLNLTEWVDELATANRLFNQMFIARSGTNAAKPDGNLENQRLVCIEQYEHLVRHITAHSTLTPSAEYNKLFKELNDITDGYNALVAKRINNGGEDELPIEGDENDPDAIPTVAEQVITN